MTIQAEPRPILFTDQPIGRLEEDHVGVGGFVLRLAHALLNPPTASSLVLGLYGAWGEGKSSILNLLRATLFRREFVKRVIIVRFNPWMYGDVATLLRTFFATLAEETGNSRLLRREDRGAMRSALQGVGDFTAAAVTAATGSSTFGALIAGSARLLPGITPPSEVTYAREKARINGILRGYSSGSSQLRVVVLVDDLDRAGDDEVRAMLRLVKLVADFTNVSYVIAMDPQRVAKSLTGDRDTSEGLSYLEKIIQIPIHVPPISSAKLEDLVIADVGRLLNAAGLNEVKFARSVLDDGLPYQELLGSRIKTLRDRARYLNTLGFVLGTGSAPDIHSEDLLLLAFLQTFFPDVYEAVRRNKRFLTGAGSDWAALLSRESEDQADSAARGADIHSSCARTVRPAESATIHSCSSTVAQGSALAEESHHYGWQFAAPFDSPAAELYFGALLITSAIHD